MPCARHELSRASDFRGRRGRRARGRPRIGDRVGGRPQPALPRPRQPAQGARGRAHERPGAAPGPVPGRRPRPRPARPVHRRRLRPGCVPRRHDAPPVRRVRVAAGGHDEVGRLASSFNTMLGALEESTRAQRQLVADASHELRTPLTSLRTNIEVLAGERSLPPGERERLLTDVVEQLGEMTTLVAELIELARGEREPAHPEEVRLDLVAADAVERTRRNRPGITFTTDLEETVVHGVPATIERAVANLLDNAAKWSPPGGQVEVVVRDGEVTVRDHGPGIDEEDLPYVFDRFYRASSARGMSGSGLGLAIVRQVAEAHGGDVVAERPEGGGTLMRLRLDGAAAAADGASSS